MIDLWPFEKEPRKVQLRALEAGIDSPGFAYFVRQRMGKTGILAANFEILRRGGVLDTLIWVTPNSLKYAIENALIDEWGIYYPIHVFEAGRKDSARYFLNNDGPRIFIINYDSLANFISYGLSDLYDHNRAMICFDQSTEIKSHNAMRTKAALKLASTHAFKRVMAGKPSSNGNHELWAQLKAIDVVSEKYYSFRNKYSRMGGYMNKQVIGDQNTKHLQNLMRPFVYIAGDEFLAEFEPKIYSPIRTIELSGEHKSIYRNMARDFVAQVEGGTITASIVLTKYLRLQQISSGIGKDDDGVEFQLIPTLQNPRLTETYNIVKEVENKVLVFYRFTQSGHWLFARLKEFNPAIIHGDMRGHMLEDNKAKFNTDPSCKVMIAQIDVARMGHTLPATDECPCDTIVFYENVYSLITRSEAESRPEKMGRKIPIEVIDLSCSPMDTMMIRALQRKEEAALALMGYARQHGVLHGTG